MVKWFFRSVLYICMCICICKIVLYVEGQFSFSLDSVKKLWALMAEDIPANQYNRLAINKVTAVCESPVIPKEFEPLSLLAKRSGVCEICAYAACTGC
uniref:Guanylate cyclase activator 2B n=1 Tax=Pygocentrus nattereri TaxID=42514 RepID=A0AAR2LS27_PYGNA